MHIYLLQVLGLVQFFGLRHIHSQFKIETPLQ